MKYIGAVPKDVQYTCLHKYLAKCQELHAVAFLQWRNLFPSRVRHDEAEILEVMTARAAKLIEGHKAPNKISKATANYGSRPYDIHDRYRDVFGPEAWGHNHGARITHLAKVCLVEPFPGEDEPLHHCE